jgi:hypothetical protein
MIYLYLSENIFSYLLSQKTGSRPDPHCSKNPDRVSVKSRGLNKISNNTLTGLEASDSALRLMEMVMGLAALSLAELATPAKGTSNYSTEKNNFYKHYRVSSYSHYLWNTFKKYKCAGSKYHFILRIWL